MTCPQSDRPSCVKPCIGIALVAGNAVKLNGLFSTPTWESWYQKGRTVLDFNEGRDDGLAVALAANHLHFSPDR